MTTYLLFDILVLGIIGGGKNEKKNTCFVRYGDRLFTLVR